MNYQQMIKQVDAEIARLNAVRKAMALAAAFGAEEGPTHSAERPKKAKKAKKATKSLWRQGNAKANGSMAPRGQCRELILQSLKNSPMTVTDLAKALLQKGWQTQSDQPANVVSMTLRSMVAKGEVRKVGNDWELSAAAGAAESIPVQTTGEVVETAI